MRERTTDKTEQENTGMKKQIIGKKTSIFIGSSTNGLSRAMALKEIIETKSGGKIECTVWNERSLFKLSYATIDSLIKIADDLKDKKGFAVLLFTPDDEVTMNKGKVGKESTYMCPRDNVVFEMGFFMGRLGRDNVICVRPENVDLRILSDWKGMTDSLYRYQRSHIMKSMNRSAEEIIDTVMGEQI